MAMQLKDSPAGFDPTKNANYGTNVDDELVDAEEV